MNILIVCPFYPPEVGAMPTRISNLAEGLSARGHSVEVICGLPNYPTGRIFEGWRGRFSSHDMVNGVAVHRYWTYATNSKGAIPRMANMFSLATTIWAYARRVSHINKLDAVIIQTPQLPLATSAVMLFKKLFRCRTVINVSDIWPLSGVLLGAMREGSAPWKVMSWMERYIYGSADMFMHQSNEIWDEIKGTGHGRAPHFLYRNLKHDERREGTLPTRKPFRIVYAGLLGVAQDLLSLVKNVDFVSLGVEMHIYGSGVQAAEIADYASDPAKKIFYHGSLPKEEMARELATYNASVVPLKLHITGAVPSKIYDLVTAGVPILFCGGGEGAATVEMFGLGYVSDPGDYAALAANIRKMVSLPDMDYEAMRRRELELARGEFSFGRQLDMFDSFLRAGLPKKHTNEAPGVKTV